MPCCHRRDCPRDPDVPCRQKLKAIVAKIRTRDAELLRRLAR